MIDVVQPKCTARAGPHAVPTQPRRCWRLATPDVVAKGGLERHWSISDAIRMKRYTGKMNHALNEGQGVEDWVLALCTAELMRSRWHLSGHVVDVPFLVQAALYSSCELTQRDLAVAISIAGQCRAW